jgi:hypothetical protein
LILTLSFVGSITGPVIEGGPIPPNVDTAEAKVGSVFRKAELSLFCTALEETAPNEAAKMKSDL